MGLAAGDALGTTLEFKEPGSFTPITDMTGRGPFGLAPGMWTDDTSIALCLAESLIECQGFNPVDQMERYLRWYREGYMSSTGNCFDIGSTVRAALERFEKTREPYCGYMLRHYYRFEIRGNFALTVVFLPLFFLDHIFQLVYAKCIVS